MIHIYNTHTQTHTPYLSIYPLPTSIYIIYIHRLASLRASYMRHTLRPRGLGAMILDARGAEVVDVVAEHTQPHAACPPRRARPGWRA